ncbi:hypothetical protein DFH06DRAFT_1140974 [Mycena polygramma]|nr:hypothetical protein DFH06DRAFT_1140974 [Mycena polygramma]
MSRVGRHRYKNVVDLDDDADDLQETTIADRGVYFSTDGRRRQVELLNVSHKKRRVNPTDLDDSLAEWIPVPDDGLNGEEGAESEVVNLGKRKEYVSTKDPMSLFRPLKKFFLDELVRHQGLGDNIDNPHCAHCEVALDTRDPTAPHAFKCDLCGQFLQCESCCIVHHQRTPLHTILVRISPLDFIFFMY